MRYRPEIDGLRAVAIIPVILFHAGLSLFGGGFVGVDVFFVISGYLITTLLLAEQAKGRFSLGRFYERRARRILPALLVVMIACIPPAWLLMLPRQFETFSISGLAALLSVSNFYFLSQIDYFSPNADLQPLVHTWSLSVEEQYYAIFPITLLALRRLGRGGLLAVFGTFVLLGLLVAEIGGREDAGRNFFFTFSRLWEIGIGSICALVLSNRPQPSSDALSLCGLFGIGFAVFVFDGTTPFPGLFALVPVVGTALIIVFAGEDTWVASRLSMAPFVGVGLISYSAYLWHQPLLAFARLGSLGEPEVALRLACVAASMGLAYVTWRYVEQPFRRRPDPVLPSRAAFFGVGGVIGAGFTAVAVIGHATDGYLARSGSMPDFILAAPDDNGLGTGCLRTFDTFNAADVVRSCSAGPPEAPLVVLLGDSHADHYASALRAGAEDGAYRFRQYTVNSCLPMKGLISRERDCSDYARAVGDLLEKTPPDLIVLSARWTAHLTGRPFDNGEGGVEKSAIDPFLLLGEDAGSPGYANALFDRFEAGIDDLLDKGPRLLVIYPSPEAGWNVPERFAKSYTRQIGRAEDIQVSTALAQYEARNAVAIARLDRLGEGLPGEDRIERFRPSDLLCDTIVAQRCVNAFDSTILYYDDDHFSNAGARFLQEGLVRAVVRALP